MLAHGDDHVVDFEALGGRLAIDRDRGGVDGAREAGRTELDCLEAAVAQRGRHGPAVHQLDAFREHVVQVLGDARHLLGVAFDGDQRDVSGALPQGLAGAVDRGVAAADHDDARAQLHLRRPHADVAQEGQPVEDALLVFAFRAHAVGLREADGEDAGVVALLQVVPADVLTHLGVRPDRDPELDETFDLAVEDILRKHPVGNPAAVEAAGLRRLLENRDRVAQARQLVRRAVSGGTRPDDRDLPAVRRAGLHDVARQGLTEVAEEPLDRADGDRLVVLPAVAGLLAGVVAHAARHGRERHVLLDERVRVEVLAAFHEVQVALDLLVRAACVVAGRHLVPVDRPREAPVARREEVLPCFL